VTIASPTPSIRSVSDVYADEYDADEGEDDGREVEVYVPGKSTSLQTVSPARSMGLCHLARGSADFQLLNCLGDIIGTGLLAVPIAIAHLGWVLGPTLLVLTGLFTLWT
jgi:vesicular inhibitory amino acid transporter